MTEGKFTDHLRDMARSLASGDKPEGLITVSMMQQQFPNLEEKNYSSYLRMTMGRIAEVKAAGALSIKRKMVNDQESEHYGVEYFQITLNKNKRKTVYTKDDLPEIEARANAKLIKRIIDVMPNLAHLSGEELQGAVKGVALYQEMIKKMMEVE